MPPSSHIASLWLLRRPMVSRNRFLMVVPLEVCDEATTPLWCPTILHARVPQAKAVDSTDSRAQRSPLLQNARTDSKDFSTTKTYGENGYLLFKPTTCSKTRKLDRIPEATNTPQHLVDPSGTDDRRLTKILLDQDRTVPLLFAIKPTVSGLA